MKRQGIVVALNDLASRFIGDGQGLNAYFVTDGDGHIDTVSFDFETAYARWSQMAREQPRHASTLEDRHHGVLASVARVTVGPVNGWVVQDDAVTLCQPKGR